MVSNIPKGNQKIRKENAAIFCHAAIFMAYAYLTLGLVDDAYDIIKRISPMRAVDNIELISGDILKISLPYFDKIVSNPPYSISSTLLQRILAASFKTAVFTFQKEFARRLTASGGEETYSALTVIASCLADVELLDEVPKEAFFPKPEVESTIVRMRLKRPLRFNVDIDVFFNVVRTLFMKRNRKVRNAIKPLSQMIGPKPASFLERGDISMYLERRVRDLNPRDFEVIADAFSR